MHVRCAGLKARCESRRFLFSRICRLGPYGELKWGVLHRNRVFRCCGLVWGICGVCGSGKALLTCSDGLLGCWWTELVRQIERVNIWRFTRTTRMYLNMCRNSELFSWKTDYNLCLLLRQALRTVSRKSFIPRVGLT